MLVIKKKFCFIFFLSLVSLIFAESIERTAKIITLTGSAQVKINKESAWQPLEKGTKLTQGAIIQTQKNSWLTLNLDGDGETATVEMEENSQLLLSELSRDDLAKTEQTLLDLALGKIIIKAKKLHSQQSKFEVKTPTSLVAVKGASFSVEVEAID